MKVSIIILLILQLLYNIIDCSFVNNRKTQLEFKKKRKSKRNVVITNKIVNNEVKKIKRKLQDDDDDEELTDSVYTRCDNGHTPDDLSDCTKNETPESSCCLFKYGQDTGCVLIGFKYLGTKSVGDMVVNCESNNIGIYNFLLLIMFIFLF